MKQNATSAARMAFSGGTIRSQPSDTVLVPRGPRLATAVATAPSSTRRNYAVRKAGVKASKSQLEWGLKYRLVFRSARTARPCTPVLFWLWLHQYNQYLGLMI